MIILTLNLAASINWVHASKSYNLNYSLQYPLINPRVNLNGDVIPVNGIQKIVIANEEAVVVAWASTLLQLLILGICIIIAFESVVIASSDTV